MDILDSDKNGKLDEDEFVNWVNEGMVCQKQNVSLSQKIQRSTLLMLSDMHGGVDGAASPIESAVHKVFADYDLDEDGHITESEFKQ